MRVVRLGTGEGSEEGRTGIDRDGITGRDARDRWNDEQMGQKDGKMNRRERKMNERTERTAGKDGTDG